MYYKDLPNVVIPYMEPMGDRDYYVAITMFVCECACLYKQKCVGTCIFGYFFASESQSERKI